MNLLPETEKNLIKKGLRARSLVVVSGLVSAGMLIGLVMLLPAFFLTRVQLATTVFDGNNSKSENADSTKAFLSLPNEVEAKIEFLEESSGKVGATNAISKVVENLPSGLIFESITFRRQAEKSKKGVNINVSGVAKTREALVSFREALIRSEYFESVDMPVGSLTKEKDLPFSISVTIRDEKVDS